MFVRNHGPEGNLVCNIYCFTLKSSQQKSDLIQQDKATVSGSCLCLHLQSYNIRPHVVNVDRPYHIKRFYYTPFN